jgi:hypothetical protein
MEHSFINITKVTNIKNLGNLGVAEHSWSFPALQYFAWKEI